MTAEDVGSEHARAAHAAADGVLGSPDEYKGLKHVDARKQWGEPDEWEGSVNDPRTREEHGIRYNEKWIYLLPDGGQRRVYWHRYNCRGVVVLDRDAVLGEDRD